MLPDALRIIAYLSFSIPLLIMVAQLSIAGKGWLMAFLITLGLSGIAYPLFSIINEFVFMSDLRSGISLLSIFWWINVPCLGFFITAQWLHYAYPSVSINALLFSFKGRINRPIFWASILVINASHLVIFAAILWQFETRHFAEITPPLTQAILLVFAAGISVWLAWMTLAIYAKRWHDLNCSGWYSLFILIPFGDLIVLIILGSQPTKLTVNRFGQPVVGAADQS